MVRALAAAALLLSACSWELPANIPCDTNEQCPWGLGCNLAAKVCVEVQGCGGGRQDNNACLSGSPQTPTIALSGNSATLTWFAGNTPNNASGFKVLRAAAQTGPYAVVGTVTPYTTQQSTFTDPELTPGKTFWYEVATAWPNNVIGTPSPPASVSIPHWNQFQPMPTGRYGLGTALVNGIVYAVGGYGAGHSLGANEAFDPATNTWAAKAPMPTPRTYLGVGAVNAVVYAVGGGNNASPVADYPTLEAYDTAANTWSTKAPMPTSRLNIAVGVINGILYVAGGQSYSNGTPLATLEAYDPVANTWSTRAPMLTARYGASAAVLGGLLYVAGGIDPVFNRSAVVEAYDPASNSWSAKPPMPTARQDSGAGVLNNLLWVVGGTPGSGVLNVVEAYDPAANAWTAQEHLALPAAATAVTTAANKLFVFGGYAQTPQTVQAYIP